MIVISKPRDPKSEKFKWKNLYQPQAIATKQKWSLVFLLTNSKTSATGARSQRITGIDYGKKKKQFPIQLKPHQLGKTCIHCEKIASFVSSTSIEKAQG